MRRTKFAAALMIVTAGSALIGASVASAEEVKARGHMPPPPPHEWREPPHHGGPGGHMPPHRDWDIGPGPGGSRDHGRPGGPGGPGGPGRPMPPHDDWRGPGGPGGPGGHRPPPRW